MMLPPRSRISPGSPAGTSWPVAVDDAQLEAGPGPPHRRGDRLDVVAGRGRRRRAALGEPVAGDDHRERQLVVDPADELDRDVGGAGDRDPEARQVVAVATGVVEDRLVDRGRAGQHGDPLLGHPGRAPGRRRTPASGSIVAPAATDARIPAFSPNMWKYGLTMR